MLLYTRFGYFTERGGVDPQYLRIVELMKGREDKLWIAPVSEVLAHLQNIYGLKEISAISNYKLQVKCLLKRIKYRHVQNLDDYHYKKSIGMLHRRYANWLQLAFCNFLTVTNNQLLIQDTFLEI